MTGKLITFEGIDCCGKGTQAKLLFEYLTQAGKDVRLMREPGGTPYGEAIRALLKFPLKTLELIHREFAGHSDFPLLKHLSIERTPQCELFLFEAARAEYVSVIRQLQDAGKHVISDRLHDSTVAYQGGGHGLPLADISAMNRVALGGILPDLTFLLDITVEKMLERMAKEGEEKNAYFEQKYDRGFFERVRQTYLSIAKNAPHRFIVIDGDQPVESIAVQIRAYVDELLDLN